MRQHLFLITIISIFLFIGLEAGYAQTTQIQYLSGIGKDSTVAWQFYLTSGRNSGAWTTIPVPSCWELKGFGGYYYQSDPATPEQGQYRFTFSVPAGWSGMSVALVFEGVMTDVNVRINGTSAGAVHQGGFYRFKYDISGLVNYGASNLLEATVSRVSADDSVNRAERQGDYWNFSGIYRPVYLEASPAQHIERTAISALASGVISAEVYLKNITTATMVSAQVRTRQGAAVGAAFSAPVTSGQTMVTVSSTITSPNVWSAETPNLYTLDLSLRSGTTTLHQTNETFGFRTVEVRAGNGIYINSQRIKFKGVNRHCFWPSEGRTLNRAVSLDDALLIRSMNMNAVRMSHYPPDAHFLDICDSIGLYVLDELAGWQKCYGLPAGRKLVEEMIVRDVNHPCIVFWDNGNEGGWNTNLDAEFPKWDIQKRSVLHPWTTFSSVNTNHYPVYSAVQTAVNGTTIYMPTEFLHGLYDGGHGAGLYDYWNLIQPRTIAAGGFLWSLVDEGVVRTDQGNIIDTRGNLAPDGITGPYREKEGSFYTIKEIWSPVYIGMDTLAALFSGTIPVENRYDFTNLSQCSFTWKLVNFDFNRSDTGRTVGLSGTCTAPSVAPHANGSLMISLPGTWSNYQGLVLTAFDPSGNELNTWSWMIKRPSDIRKAIVDTAGAPAATLRQTTDSAVVTAGTMVYAFSKANARLIGVKKSGKNISLMNGPALAVGTAALSSINCSQQGSVVLITAGFSNAMNVQWTIYGNGWIRLHYDYTLNGSYDYLGVNFDYPESMVTGMQWLGKGPCHVWKNRLKGTTFNVWRNAYNDGIAGQNWTYPEFKGYFADMNWARLFTTEDTLNFVFDDKNIFFRNLTPRNGTTPVNCLFAIPGGNLSFLHGISPIGNKFHLANAVGPEGQQNTVNGTFAATVFMYFGKWVQQTSARGSDEAAVTGALNRPALVFQKDVIRYFIPEKGSSRLTMSDILGREMVLFDGWSTEPGWHSVSTANLYARIGPLAQGAYIVRLQTKGSTSAIKRIFIFR